MPPKPLSDRLEHIVELLVSGLHSFLRQEIGGASFVTENLFSSVDRRLDDRLQEQVRGVR